MINHALDWNKNKRCSCVHNIENPTYETMIICRHLEADRIAKFESRIGASVKEGLTNSIIDLKELLHFEGSI